MTSVTVGSPQSRARAGFNSSSPKRLEIVMRKLTMEELLLVGGGGKCDSGGKGGKSGKGGKGGSKSSGKGGKGGSKS